MSKKSIALTILLLAIITLLIFLFTMKKDTKQAVWDIERNLRYSFTLENKSSKLIQNAVFKTYSPLMLSSTQKLIALESTHEFAKKNDKFGNQEMVFAIDSIPPFGKKKITITAKLMLSKIVAQTAAKDNLFTSSQPMIESNNQDIIDLAKSFKGTAIAVQKSIYDWQVDNLDYSGYGFHDKGALYAITNLQGDCTEFAYLNVAINRALNNPSRAVNGYVVTRDMKLNTSKFHTWSEVWFDGAWQVVDAQKQEFMSNQHNYIGMNIVTDAQTNKQNFKRFWISDPDLNVTMN